MGQNGDKKQGVYSIHAGCGALYGSRSRSQNKKPLQQKCRRGFFFECYISIQYLTSQGGEGLSPQVWMVRKKAIHSDLHKGPQLCCHVTFRRRAGTEG